MSGGVFLLLLPLTNCLLFFFFNDTATTEIYTLSLHDALPIFAHLGRPARRVTWFVGHHGHGDRKSTRLNSSHQKISYAVFCLKKKKRQYKKVYEGTVIYRYLGSGCTGLER